VSTHFAEARPFRESGPQRPPISRKQRLVVRWPVYGGVSVCVAADAPVCVYVLRDGAGSLNERVMGGARNSDLSSWLFFVSYYPNPFDVATKRDRGQARRIVEVDLRAPADTVKNHEANSTVHWRPYPKLCA
jgi:hypothetical protein